MIINLTKSTMLAILASINDSLEFNTKISKDTLFEYRYILVIFSEQEKMKDTLQHLNYLNKKIEMRLEK